MSNKITIVDYGLGNLHNLRHTLDHLKIQSEISNKFNKILNAERIILPGVGAFAAGMQGLKNNGLIEILDDFVASGKPVLGICLGMQLLMKSSTEYGNHKGLGYVDGKVLPFNPFHKNKIKFKVPQIGWNKITLKTKAKNQLFNHHKKEPYFYFIHSYFINVENENNSIASTKYAEIKYCSALNKKNIYGVQFHPELSGVVGLQVLKNFSQIN